MLSKIIKKIKDIVYRFKYRNFSYLQKLEAGVFVRSYYGYCIYKSAELGVKLGYKRITIIEFGVAGGNGLLTIENHCEEIKKIFDIEFDIYGFDTGIGLPKPKDYKDQPYLWGEGFFKMNLNLLKSKLKQTRLIIGDVKNTTKKFKNKDNSPIGFISFDLDYYSSTKEALNIFNRNEKYLLPRIQCYFDDVGTINSVGELQAIKEYNKKYKNRTLSTIYTQVFNRNILGERIFEHHMFDHQKYNYLVKPIKHNKLNNDKE